MSQANATLTFTIKGTPKGRDPVTRQPIFNETTKTIRVFVRQDRRPTTQIFPGADETQEVLKGELVNPAQLPSTIAPDAVCTVALDQGITATGQIKMLADQWGSRQEVYGRRMQGTRFYLLVERQS